MFTSKSLISQMEWWRSSAQPDGCPPGRFLPLFRQIKHLSNAVRRLFYRRSPRPDKLQATIRPRISGKPFAISGMIGQKEGIALNRLARSARAEEGHRRRLTSLGRIVAILGTLIS